MSVYIYGSGQPYTSKRQREIECKASLSSLSRFAPCHFRQKASREMPQDAGSDYMVVILGTKLSIVLDTLRRLAPLHFQ